jgi:hypothetical protein
MTFPAYTIGVSRSGIEDMIRTKKYIWCLLNQCAGCLSYVDDKALLTSSISCDQAYSVCGTLHADQHDVAFKEHVADRWQDSA